MQFVLIGLVALAIPLIYHGRARRIGCDPYCRACSYLLRGLASGRCPECGATLCPAAIVYGERSRRWPAFAAGWLVLLLAISIFFLSAFSSIDWYHYEPTFFVFGDLNSANPAAVRHALEELARRDGQGTLSARSRDKLVRFALKQQGAATPPYSVIDTDAINYLGIRLNAGDLPPEQKAKIFDQALQTHLAIRRKVVTGDQIPFRAVLQGLGPSNGTFWFSMSGNGATLDGQKVNGNTGSSIQCTAFGGGSFGSSIDQRLLPGKHEISLDFRVEVFTGTLNSPSAVLLYRSNRLLTGSFEVVADKSQAPLQTVFDRTLSAAMKSAITPEVLRYSARNKWLSGGVSVQSLPANIAFDIFARYGGAEYSLAGIAWTTNAGGLSNGIGGKLQTPPPPMIDLIFRPSAKRARESVDLLNYWNQEIVYSNVPVSTN